jgi:Tfp pilus tip-associated adhesin PilY1
MKLQKLSALLAVFATATVVDLFPAANPAAALQLTGLTDGNKLLRFDSATPGMTTRVSVTGVNGTLLGIDLRPANNLIYGLTDTNKIYTIDPFSGAATFVSTLSVPFTGGQDSGVDFNPVPDRLRVVGTNDQNFRINVDTGAVTVDGTLNPGNPSISAVAYTNADNDPATGTTLYDIDLRRDQLLIQNPPNDGTLTPVGYLGDDFRRVAGFDIVTENGINTGFAALIRASNNRTSLFTIDLNSGAATEVGFIGDGREKLVGLTAVPVAVPTPALLPGLLTLGVAVWKRKGQPSQGKDVTQA